jgi:hypothetical protein
MVTSPFSQKWGISGTISWNIRAIQQDVVKIVNMSAPS